MPRRYPRPAPVMALLLSLALPAAAQEAPDRVEGKVLVPSTSIEQPGDRGHKAHTNHRILLEPAGGLGPAGGMTPAQLRSFYGMPATGGHDLIAIVDAYHYPSALADFNVFSSQFGLPLENSSNPLATTNTVFRVVYATGTQPKTNAGWAQEAALDIQWAHAMAPAAKIVLVEAASASFADLYKAVDVAAKLPGVTHVSLSWGAGETSGETAYESHFNLGGPLFFASAGDTGGQVIYPSSSQYVVAVGGTSTATGASGLLTTESAWSNGGGGTSAYVALPAWQSGVTHVGARRSTPDLSSDADPNTGVAVYDSTAYKGYKGWMVFGGTSVSSPCMAGMVNVSGVSYPSTTAFLTALYNRFKATPASFRDIVSGSNGFPALTGWDFTTGVGAPINPASF